MMIYNLSSDDIFNVFQELFMQVPLTETTFFILLSLHSGPRHGYSIMKEAQRLSEDRIALSTGTLYGALKRLLEMAWIERLDGPDSAPLEWKIDGRGQKVYALTEAGRRVLNLEVTRLEALLRQARVQRVEGES
jgi:DNA-binding PadR family transcriptional regulator